MIYDKTSPTEIELFAKKMIGNSFKSILPDGEKEFRGKGGLGQLVEKYHFGYKPNSDKGPDFSEAGVELKVTPFRKLRKSNEYSAKERVVLNIINFEEVVYEEFSTSSFWNKNKLTLFMFYLYEEEVENRLDFIIKYAQLFDFPKEDIKIIEDDWNKIINKIKDGKAHEISEGDTMYLGACTKGSKKIDSYRKQPYSHIKAPQRAFSLKQSYVTSILRDYFIPMKSTYISMHQEISELKEDNAKVAERNLDYGVYDLKDNSIIKDISDLKNTTFEKFVLDKISNYYGKEMKELCKEFEVNIRSKSATQQVILNLLGVKLKTAKEFTKANIQVKAIRIESNGKIKQHMSFPAFKFKDIIKEEWESSNLRYTLEQNKFLFVIYRFDEAGNLFLEKSMFWNMPINVLDNEVKSVWDKTVKVIREGVVLTQNKKGTITYNNFPASSENSVCHVRPHAQTTQDTYPLPDGRNMTKQSFWLHRNFILEQVK